MWPIPAATPRGSSPSSAPLVQAGLLPADADLACFSLTGYSGGGKKMIAQYEGADRAEILCSPGIYGLGQDHKHLPEMQTICGLTKMPVFSPIVDDYYKGMAATVPLHMDQLTGACHPASGLAGPGGPLRRGEAGPCGPGRAPGTRAASSTAAQRPGTMT